MSFLQRRLAQRRSSKLTGHTTFRSASPAEANRVARYVKSVKPKSFRLCHWKSERSTIYKVTKIRRNNRRNNRAPFSSPLFHPLKLKRLFVNKISSNQLPVDSQHLRQSFQAMLHLPLSVKTLLLEQFWTQLPQTVSFWCFFVFGAVVNKNQNDPLQNHQVDIKQRITQPVSRCRRKKSTRSNSWPSVSSHSCVTSYITRPYINIL